MRSNSTDGWAALLFSALVLFAVTATSPGPATAQSECLSSGDVIVVRLDEPNRRVFGVGRSADVESNESLTRLLMDADGIVSRCRPEWGSDWKLSLFADERYAGYMDEPHIRPYLDDGRWAAGYLAECSIQDGRCVTHPLLPAEQKVWTFEAAPH